MIPEVRFHRQLNKQALILGIFTPSLFFGLLFGFLALMVLMVVRVISFFNFIYAIMGAGSAYTLCCYYLVVTKPRGWLAHKYHALCMSKHLKPGITPPRHCIAVLPNSKTPTVTKI